MTFSIIFFLQVSSSGVNVDQNSQELIFEATFLSNEAVRCEANTTASWEVYISNNVSILSNPLHFIAYDSNCQQCNEDGACTIRVSY